MDEEERRRTITELQQKLVGFAAKAEGFLDHDAIANAFTFALVLYVERRSSRAEAIAFLRGIADDLEASASYPPAAH